MRKYLTILALGAWMPCLQADMDLMQDEIEHVVVLMMENRSFDNVLAWLYNNDTQPNYFIPENTDPTYLGLSESTLSQYTNVLKDSSGQFVFSSPPIKGVPSMAGSRYLNSPSTDPNEAFSSVTNQIFGFDGGTKPTMSGFLQDFAGNWPESTWTYVKPQICAVMETYTEKELPVLHSLARHYAVSDLWFCSVPTQTDPNRAFTICGTSGGQIVNGDVFSTFYSDTIWNRLSELSPDTTWMIFWQSNLIPEIYKGPYTDTHVFANLERIPDLNSHYNSIDEFHKRARNGQLPNFTFLEPIWTLTDNMAPHNFLLKYFNFDLNRVKGLQGCDFHPPGDVRPADDFLGNVYTSLIANPEAWEKTLLIVLFDEHGGLFDHVAPPTAHAPDDQAQNGFAFDRYGVRVPAIFISPKVGKGGIIRSNNPDTPFDHTSLIATILKWRGIDKTKWGLGKRVDRAPTFENVITQSDSREDRVLKPDSVSLPKTYNVVRMGDKFYLRNKNGEYLTHSHFFFRDDARIGSAEDKVILSAVGGSGTLTHGSFLLIQSNDPALGNANFLGTSAEHADCIYAENTHDSAQWWTIKSADRAYVGAPIQYGDRVYLENHTYFDPQQYLPTRMAIDSGIFGKFVRTQTITEADFDERYWYLEKVEVE